MPQQWLIYDTYLQVIDLLYTLCVLHTCNRMCECVPACVKGDLIFIQLSYDK